jgi:hypothetical protein
MQQPIAWGVAAAPAAQGQTAGMPQQTQQLLLAQAQAQAHGMQQIVNSGTYQNKIRKIKKTNKKKLIKKKPQFSLTLQIYPIQVAGVRIFIHPS